jgi:hypothetical protein
MDFDLNFPRGHLAMQSSNEPAFGSTEVQDRHIATRINKLFFAEVVKRIQSRKEIDP